jgi:hypothetical protein
MPPPVLGNTVFIKVLGYTLRREFLGDAIHYRNVEEYTYEIQVTDLANFAPGCLSTFIQTEIANYFNTNKTNITLKSLDLSASNEATEDLIRGGVIKPTFEIRSPVATVDLDSSHPELAGTAEGTRFVGVKSVLTSYAEYIDSLSETYDFNDDEQGSQSFNHSIDLTLRSSAGATAKTMAQDISNTLFTEDKNNTAFGENVWAANLQEYGDEIKHKQYHTESYDLKTNKFAFTKKAKILGVYVTFLEAGEPDSLTIEDNKYSLSRAAGGEITVTETTQIRAISGDYSHISDGLLDHLKSLSFSNCVTFFTAFAATIEGLGAASKQGILHPIPVSRNISFDKRELKASVTTVFSNNPQIAGHTIEETVNLDKNTNGIVTADYDLTLTVSAQKELNGDATRDYDGATAGVQSSVDLLTAYDSNAINRVIAIAKSDLDPAHALWIMPFMNTVPDVFLNGTFVSPAGTPNRYHSSGTWVDFAPTNTTITSSNMGKTYSLKKKFSNDPVFISARSNTACVDCFTKFDVKVDDTFPKENMNEYVIIDRGTSALTGNTPRTSVRSHAFTNAPGKRTVNINAVLTRQPGTNRVFTPTFPTNELRAMAVETRKQLLDVLSEWKVRSTMQSVGYLSSLRYTFDSSGNITMTGEIEYTFKPTPPPGA